MIKQPVIDLDSFEKKSVAKPIETHERVKSNVMNTIMAEIPEEEKDSNFGDYGPESDSEDDSDDDDDISDISA